MLGCFLGEHTVWCEKFAVVIFARPKVVVFVDVVRKDSSKMVQSKVKNLNLY